jgi:hypothetical protein
MRPCLVNPSKRFALVRIAFIAVLTVLLSGLVYLQRDPLKRGVVVRTWARLRFRIASYVTAGLKIIP